MKKLSAFFFDLTLDHIWGFVILAGIFIFNNTHPIRLHDFWLAIAQGRQISLFGIPAVDPFSFTNAGAVFRSAAAYWLGDVSLYYLYKFGGEIFIIVLNTILLTLTYGILLYLNIGSGRALRPAAAALLFSVALGFNDWNVRPQVFSYLLGVILLLAIQKYDRTASKKWLLIPPLVMLLWVNIHASFPLGALIIICWFLGLVFKDGFSLGSHLTAPFVSALSSGLVCFINPKGFKVLESVFGLLGSPIQNYITEWRPPTFETLGGTLLLLGLACVLILIILNVRRVPVFHLLLFVVFGYFAIKYIRSAVWFGIAMSPLLSYLLSRYIPSRPSSGSVLMNLFLVLLISVTMIFSLPWFKPLYASAMSPEKAGNLAAEIPVQATQYLLDHQLPQNVFHDMGFGSYLMWAAYPKYKLFIDPRFDVGVYPVKFWDEYLAIGRADAGWDVSLEKYNIQTLMLSPLNQEKLIKAARSSTAWAEVYADETAVIFLKK